MLKVIFLNLIWSVQWMIQLCIQGTIILVIRWRWLKTGWMRWVDLTQRLVLLGIVTNMIQVLVRVVDVQQIISIYLFRSVQWMIHLCIQGIIILIIWRWWLKTGWMTWVYLCKCLFSWNWLSSICVCCSLNCVICIHVLIYKRTFLVIFLGIVTNMVLIFVWVVPMFQVILVGSIFHYEWLSQLSRHVILLV